MQSATHNHLRRSVRPPDTGHVVAALIDCEDVGHDSQSLVVIIPGPECDFFLEEFGGRYDRDTVGRDAVPPVPIICETTSLLSLV